MVHIGSIIEKIFLEKGMKSSVFADKIGTVQRNIYNIFKRSSIDTDLLIAISQVLEYDFFRHYINTTFS